MILAIGTFIIGLIIGYYCVRNRFNERLCEEFRKGVELGKQLNSLKLSRSVTEKKKPVKRTKKTK